MDKLLIESYHNPTAMNYLTIKQASELSHKSDKTIRRLIKRLIAEDEALTAGKVIQDKQTGLYAIEESYLLDQLSSPTSATGQQGSGHDYPLVQPNGETSQPKSTQMGRQAVQSNESRQVIQAKEETITLLQEQIKQLNSQLNKKDDHITELLARDKERNILFHKFQDALMLQSPKQRAGETEREPIVEHESNIPVQETPAPKPTPSRSTAAAKKPVKKMFEKKQKPPEKPKRKGLFGLFHK